MWNKVPKWDSRSIWCKVYLYFWRFHGQMLYCLRKKFTSTFMKYWSFDIVKSFTQWRRYNLLGSSSLVPSGISQRFLGQVPFGGAFTRMSFLDRSNFGRGTKLDTHGKQRFNPKQKPDVSCANYFSQYFLTKYFDGLVLHRMHIKIVLRTPQSTLKLGFVTKTRCANWVRFSLQRFLMTWFSFET